MRHWLWHLQVAALALALAAPAFAAGTLVVTITAPGEATITLTAPDGSLTTEKTSAGQISLAPKAAGSYQLRVAAGGKSDTASVEVPVSGQVQAVFNPSGQPMITVYVSAVEEVTVTSQRFEESLQKVPIAVTAFGGRQLEQTRAANIQELAAATPNLWMEKNTGTSSGGRANLRGVGEDESFFTSDTPVGIYVDDIYIPRQTGAQFDLYDLERVEVLRGPQGTLYGRNTSAGAIRFVSREPGNRFRANLDGTLGSYTRTDLRGSVNAPMGEKAALQVAGILRKHDGYDLEAVGKTEVNDQDVAGGRASLRLLPSPKWNILLVGDLIRERSTPGYAVAFVPQPPVINGFGVGKLDYNKQLDGDSDIHTIASDLRNPMNDLDQTGLHGVVGWTPSDRLAIKSITGYRKLDNLLLLDADGRVGNFAGLNNNAPSFHLYQDQHQHQWSQELQLQGRAGQSFRYILGFYYFNEHNDQRTENIIFNPQGRNNYWDVTLDTDSAAGFGSATWRANEKLTLTAGGRYTHDSKSFTTILFNPAGAQVVACVAPDGRIVAGARPCNASDPAGSVSRPVQKAIDESWGAFTPRFAIDYAATPEALLYASASRGFKSGAFDGRSNTAATILPLQPIIPETLWSYEAGVKTDWARNRLRLNLAAFLNEWNDLQGSGTDPNGNFKRFSLGDVETKGVELEGKLVPARGLELSGQLSFLRTRYKTVNFNQAVDCAPYGTGSAKLELKQSPHTSWQVAGYYTTPNPIAGGRWSFGGSYAGKGETFQTTCNAGVGLQEAWQLLDASVSWESKDGRVRITAAGDNLTDEQYLIGSFAIPGLRMAAGYFNPPRRYSVTLRYAYN